MWELRVGADDRSVTVSGLSPGGERMPQWQLSPEQLPQLFALPPALPGDTELFGWRISGPGSSSCPGPVRGWRGRPPPAGPDPRETIPAGFLPVPVPGSLAATGLPGMDPGMDPFQLRELITSAEADPAPSYLYTINWADTSPP